MKKRIFAVFMTALVLLSALVVPCFAADENNPGGDVESPYYWFTLSVGQPIDLSVIPEDDGPVFMYSNFVIRGSGKQANRYVNFAFTNGDYGSAYAMIIEFYSDHFAITDGDFNYHLYVNLDESTGIIRNMTYESPSGDILVEYVTISFNDYFTYGDGSTEASGSGNISNFLNTIRSVGIDLNYHEETTVFGVLGLMFKSVGDVVSGLGRGIRDGARNLIYSNGVNGGISSVVTFIFIIAGLSIAMTVFFMVWRLIRFKRQR
ncbi:MAG: hypothetical protein IKA05_06840 [Clostridia bacterium]|nr:hypothetical protein [Clostridia bacterium]